MWIKGGEKYFYKMNLFVAISCSGPSNILYAISLNKKNDYIMPQIILNLIYFLSVRLSISISFFIFLFLFPNNSQSLSLFRRIQVKEAPPVTPFKELPEGFCQFNKNLHLLFFLEITIDISFNKTHRIFFSDDNNG